MLTKTGPTVKEQIGFVDEALTVVEHEMEHGRHFKRSGETMVSVSLDDLRRIRLALWAGRSGLMKMQA